MKVAHVILFGGLLALMAAIPFLDREHARNIRTQSVALSNEVVGLTSAVHDEVTQLKTAILLAGALGFEHGRGYELGRTNCACSNLIALLRLSYHITNDVPELDRIYGR